MTEKKEESRPALTGGSAYMQIKFNNLKSKMATTGVDFDYGN